MLRGLGDMPSWRLEAWFKVRLWYGLSYSRIVAKLPIEQRHCVWRVGHSSVVPTRGCRHVFTKRLLRATYIVSS